MTTHEEATQAGDRAVLHAAAARSILDTHRRLRPAEWEAATALLTDLYAASVRHGISPEHWSWVSSLGNDCIEAIKERQARQTQQARRGQRRGSLARGSRDRDQQGRGRS